MIKKKVLLAGETWASSAVHTKGFDQFSSTTFHSGAGPFLEALADSAFEVHHMHAHDCASQFPQTMEALREYDAVVLSDLGSNTLLLPPEVWLSGKPFVNRLKLLREWVGEGGGLMMAGGYLSFQGIDGKARWRGTAVEEVLPVRCLPYDDRLEIPEGFQAQINNADHPIMRGLQRVWPLLLGANEVVLSPIGDAEVLASLPEDQGGHPLLVSGSWKAGRAVAWTTDIGPHWVPTEFIEWSGYKTLWNNILSWITGLD